MQKTTQLPVEVAKELKLLRGFKDIVAERVGYMYGRSSLMGDMNKDTEKERKVASAQSKAVKENVETYIEAEKPTADMRKNILTSRKTLKDARKTLKEAKAPHMKKISPLGKAVKYLDTVAVPDSLIEIDGQRPQARFSLSKWVTEALEK